MIDSMGYLFDKNYKPKNSRKISKELDRWNELKQYLIQNLVEFGQFKECHTGELERTYQSVLSKMEELENKNMINWGDNNPLYRAYQRIQEEREVGRSLAQRENSEKLSLIDTGLVIAANIIKDIQKEEIMTSNEHWVELKKTCPKRNR